MSGGGCGFKHVKYRFWADKAVTLQREEGVMKFAENRMEDQMVHELGTVLCQGCTGIPCN